MTTDSSHFDLVRDRFTKTAESFADFVLTHRMAEAGRLADLAAAELPNLADAITVDVACGPGTFALAFAPRVRRAVGVDLTPAMLERARRAAADARLANLEFTLGDAYTLPFGDGSVRIVSCGYALHHMLEPARAIGEMARITAPGGRVAIVDMILPAGASSAAKDAIEKARDPSHTTTLSVAQFKEIFRKLGLRVLHEETFEMRREFDVWMRGAGRAPGDPSYAATRRLMQESMRGDAAGFHPAFSEKSGALEFSVTSAMLIAEKVE